MGSPGPIVRRLGPLQEGPFARLFSAMAISAVGDWASAVALTFGILAFGSATDLGLVFLAREIPIIALVLAGGVYADRLPRRMVLAGSYAVRAATQLGTAAVLLSDHRGLAAIAALQAVNGGATAFSRPAIAGFVPEVVSALRLQPANALMGLSRNAVAVVGAALGAGLVTGVGAGWALALDATTFVIAGVLIVSIRAAVPPARAQASPLADLKEGWTAMRARTWLWVMILAFGAFQFAFFPSYLVLGPIVARDHLGGASAWAGVLTAQAVGGLTGGMIAVRLRVTRPLVAMNLVILGAVAELALLAAAAPLALIVVAAFTAGLGFALSDPLWLTTLQRLIPDDQIGRVSSFDWLGSMALNPIGYALVGPVAAVAGAGAVLGGAAALLAAACLVPLMVPAVRAVRLPPADGSAENA